MLTLRLFLAKLIVFFINKNSTFWSNFCTVVPMHHPTLSKMFNIKCKLCGHIHTVSESAITFNCPKCNFTIRLDKKDFIL